jgi:hypothetical protein
VVVRAYLIASKVTDARGHAVTECVVAGQPAVRRSIQALRAAGRWDIEP